MVQSGIAQAEKEFTRGRTALTQGRLEEAAAAFGSALRLERESGRPRSQMRYLSYCGLTSALAGRATPESIRACELAVRKSFLSPEMHLNLGRVYLMAGKTTRALATFEKGLNINPNHKRLRLMLKDAERREPPPIRMLSRSHPLNRMLGKLRRRYLQ